MERHCVPVSKDQFRPADKSPRGYSYRLLRLQHLKALGFPRTHDKRGNGAVVSALQGQDGRAQAPYLGAIHWVCGDWESNTAIRTITAFMRGLCIPEFSRNYPPCAGYSMGINLCHSHPNKLTAKTKNGHQNSHGRMQDRHGSVQDDAVETCRQEHGRKVRMFGKAVGGRGVTRRRKDNNAISKHPKNFTGGMEV